VTTGRSTGQRIRGSSGGSLTGARGKASGNGSLGLGLDMSGFGLEVSGLGLGLEMTGFDNNTVWVGAPGGGIRGMASENEGLGGSQELNSFHRATPC